MIRQYEESQWNALRAEKDVHPLVIRLFYIRQGDGGPEHMMAEVPLIEIAKVCGVEIVGGNISLGVLSKLFFSGDYANVLSIEDCPKEEIAILVSQALAERLELITMTLQRMKQHMDDVDAKNFKNRSGYAE